MTEPTSVPERVWIGMEHGRAYRAPLKGTIEYTRTNPEREAAINELVEASKAVCETIENTTPTWFPLCNDTRHPDDCQCQSERLRAALAALLPRPELEEK